MSLNDYINSFKISNYQSSISDIKKYFIDEMINKNFSYFVISNSTGISEDEIFDYFNNEWCNKYPERYHEIMFVKWINSVSDLKKYQIHK